MARRGELARGRDPLVGGIEEMASDFAPEYDELFNEHFQRIAEREDEIRTLAIEAGKEGVNQYFSNDVRDEANSVIHKKGWTQKKVAKKFGIPEASLSRFLNGTGNLDLKNLVALIVGLKLAKFQDKSANYRRCTVGGFLAALVCVRAYIQLSEEHICPSESGDLSLAVIPINGRVRAPERLEDEHYWCLYHMFQVSGWLGTELPVDVLSVQELASRVLSKARHDLGRNMSLHNRFQHLKDLADNWGGSYLITTYLLGHEGGQE